MTTILSPFLQLEKSPLSSKGVGRSRKRPRHTVNMVPDMTLDSFAEELKMAFEQPLRGDMLLALSGKLRAEYKSRLQESSISMLPSYNHTLPTGDETGDCLALDVGGSTLRIALIRLSGRASRQSMQIRNSVTHEIDDEVKSLKGQAFFDWMACRVEDMLAAGPALPPGEVLSMGLAWSFPIEQTSSRTGILLAMGKGFHAAIGLERQDLSEIIMCSFRARRLPVKMTAIVNDAAATLLSQAYVDATARMSLILGTGMNAAVYLPVGSVADAKYGNRPDSWHAVAHHVLVNTELSMFGKGSMTITRWDEALDTQHQTPGFQPMEYLIGGLYLGEIVRLVLLEAIDKFALFGGEIPEGLSRPYTLKTRTIAPFEREAFADLSVAGAQFLVQHPLSREPSSAELTFVRDIVKLVSHRAQAYLATAIHALWMLRNEAEDAHGLVDVRTITVACNGTVIEKYPNFRSNCQQILDDLCIRSGASAGNISLEMAPESSIYGAAVAVSCIKEV